MLAYPRLQLVLIPVDAGGPSTWRIPAAPHALPAAPPSSQAMVSVVRVRPRGIPSRESAETALELLVQHGYDACEIDFGGGFWMDWDYARRVGAARSRRRSSAPRPLAASAQPRQQRPFE
jgi:hypothetical protein